MTRVSCFHSVEMVVLYVASVSEDLRRVCRRFDIGAVFTTISTLQKQLTHVKDVDPPCICLEWCTIYPAVVD